jgi:hypothetical protein
MIVPTDELYPITSRAIFLILSISVDGKLSTVKAVLLFKAYAQCTHSHLRGHRTLQLRALEMFHAHIDVDENFYPTFTPPLIRLLAGISEKRKNSRRAGEARIHGKLPKYCEKGTGGGKSGSEENQGFDCAGSGVEHRADYCRFLFE